MSAEFIKMISDVQFERFNAHIGDLVKNQTPIGIFSGFEVIPSEIIKQIQAFRNLNISCVIVLADIQANALKKFIDVPVITLEDFDRFGEENFPIKPQEIFAFNIDGFVFLPYFARYGIEIFNPSDDYNGKFFFMMRHLPELYTVYQSLGSEESRKVFCAAIKGNLTGKINNYRFAPEAQYFLEGFYPNASDIVIDGGAYDGATAISFAKRGAKVFAFEMDETNYKKCQKRLSISGNYDIILENLGLSDKESSEKYFHIDTASRKNPNGNLTANFIDLDTYVAKKNLPRVDYIKLDIEGAELDMLHGAAKTITRCKPKMAVSAYHKPEDLWTLATYIKSLRPDYQFEFRHYKIDCTDYILDDNKRALLKYFGLEYFAPTNCEYLFYCR